jgi:hypothetical protein
MKTGLIIYGSLDTLSGDICDRKLVEYLRLGRYS